MRVLKFGGSSLSTPEKIVHVAKHIADLHRSSEKLVVVVSAMGETTNQLLSLANSVSRHPFPRELDMLLTTGERVSMALLSMALRDQGCPSISFTGSQAGIFTEGSHYGAKITDIRPHRVLDALQNNQVVVLAGFQGVDPLSKEITTLGRGGSDTTAVAMAAQLQAKSCDLLKDIDSVGSADPKIIKQPVFYRRLPTQTLYEMCFWGAKILHHRSVELALRKNVKIGIGSSQTFRVGTYVSHSTEDLMSFEDQQCLAVTSHAAVHHVHIQCKDLQQGFVRFEQELKEFKLSWPQILASAFSDQECRIMYTADENHLSALRECLKSKSEINVRSEALSSVTLTCYGSVGSDLPKRALKTLSEENINPEKVIMGPMSMSFFVLPHQREAAIESLHKLVKDV